MQLDTPMRNILSNTVSWEYKMSIFIDIQQNYFAGDRWSQALGFKLCGFSVEISTGRSPAICIYLPSQRWDCVWCAQTQLVGETRCYELSFRYKGMSHKCIGVGSQSDCAAS